jgi:hypothetical protein
VGYESCEKGYKVYDLKSEKIVLSRSVIFSEDKSWNWERNQTNTLPIPLNLEGMKLTVITMKNKLMQLSLTMLEVLILTPQLES